MPTHANASAWLTKGTELSISATATPAAPTSKRKYNGISAWDMKAGEHRPERDDREPLPPQPQLRFIAGHELDEGISFGGLWGVVPSAPLANSELIYRALTDVSFSTPPGSRRAGRSTLPGCRMCTTPPELRVTPTAWPGTWRCMPWPTDPGPTWHPQRRRTPG